MINISILRIVAFLQSLRLIFLSRASLVLEITALKQQVITLKKNNPRPRISQFDRFFWVVLKRTWRKWIHSLVIVKPETVLKWHRRGFRLYWSFISRGNKTTNSERKREIRRLILKLKTENPSWGAPRIHGELLKLGFHVSERTVSRYLPKNNQDRSSLKWLAFLNNHRASIAAMDFFVVPTLFFKPLYGFFLISHQRRKILHFNVTYNPTAGWVVNQLRAAFSRGHSLKYLIFDREAMFSSAVCQTLKSFAIEPIRTSYKSPWQNGIAERFIGNCRRELLDQVIILNPGHLYRLLSEYIDYYHNDRTHYGLDKDTPFSRAVEERPSSDANIISLPRINGLHIRYTWKNAA